MKKKIDEVREVTFDDRKRAITGILLVGLGGAMIVSAYIKLPQGGC